MTPFQHDFAHLKLAVVGLGYVGLPLAVAFGKQLPTLGFDRNQQRIAQLQQGEDITLELDQAELHSASALRLSAQASDLATCNTFIVAVPTQIDDFKTPDFQPLIAATRTIAQHLRPGSLVIFESTVYPGATEEICVPVLEQITGLKFNQDFFVGYSPERINPGDKQHRLENIIKVTAGSTPEVADFVDALYRRIITAGTFKASSIRVAEAAKVIENTQRDVNIALINELAKIFNRLDLDTHEVLQAASSKWNFLPFQPGLVGGHCIGVDPYYLTHKAQQIGYHPEIILAGRRINDSMGAYVAAQVVKLMTQQKIPVVDASVLILGLSFKENCPDIRNTRVIDIIDEFRSYNAQVQVYDPWVYAAQADEELNIELLDQPPQGHFDAIILAVAHDHFRDLGLQAIRDWGKPACVLYDIKHVFPRDLTDGCL
jgi:UDP-N-acetyl-D-galactosamine dehydrogenase